MGFFSKAKGKIKIVLFTALMCLSGGGTAAYLKYAVYDYAKNFSVVDNTLTGACFFGDSGEEGDMQESIARLANASCKENFILGDIIYETGLDDVDDPQFDTKFFNIFGHVPSNLVLGNHDVIHKGSAGYMLKRAEKYPNVHFPNYFWTKAYADACVIGIDSNIYTGGKVDFLEVLQTNHVRKSIADERCKGKLLILIDHHPYISSGQHGNSSGPLKKFYENEVLDKVDFILSGHDHNLSDEGFVGAKKRTRQYVSGASSTLRDCKTDNPKCMSIPGILQYVGRREGFTFLTYL